jgi:ATP-dependent DNA helicase RecG
MICCLSAVKTTQKTTQETTQKKNVYLMKAQPSITRRELAQKIGLTDAGVKYHLDRLRKNGCIRHIGSTKSGHWEVREN